MRHGEYRHPPPEKSIKNNACTPGLVWSTVHGKQLPGHWSLGCCPAAVGTVQRVLAAWLLEVHVACVSPEERHDLVHFELHVSVTDLLLLVAQQFIYVQADKLRAARLLVHKLLK